MQELPSNYQNEFSSLSRDYWQDMAVLREAMDKRTAQYTHDCEELEKKYRTPLNPHRGGVDDKSRA